MAVSYEPKVQSAARRHFLAVSARAATKSMAAAALLAAMVPPARADPKGNAYGYWRNHDPAGANCFLQGTRIRTADGEKGVEDIRIGDLVETLRGEALPVKWIGRNSFRKSGPLWSRGAMPVRVSRFAIREGMPHRDLYLSPGHALYIDRFLMPVKDLVNGVSILPALPSPTESLEYFQIVLATHEVIWAEGLPVETFVANSAAEIERFANFADYKRRYPNDPGPRIPIAPNLGTWPAHMGALFAAGLSCVAEMRDPLHETYARIARRARFELA